MLGRQNPESRGEGLGHRGGPVFSPRLFGTGCSAVRRQAKKQGVCVCVCVCVCVHVCACVCIGKVSGTVGVKGRIRADGGVEG